MMDKSKETPFARLLQYKFYYTLKRVLLNVIQYSWGRGLENKRKILIKITRIKLFKKLQNQSYHFTALKSVV